MRRAMAFMGVVCFLVLAIGCERSDPDPSRALEFQPVPLAETPVRLQRHYRQLKAGPGLTVMRHERLTYLLLCAGGAEGPGHRAEILEISLRGPAAKEARVLATVRRGESAADYPCAVVRVAAQENLDYLARLNTLGGGVVELSGVRVTT